MDVAPVIDGARDRYGVDVTILRLVETEDRWPPNGGAVTYLAQTSDRPARLEPIVVDMADHPLRARWARPGGVDALVEWADGHIDRTGPPEQLRTWNLSLIVRLPAIDGPVWLKAVPPFFAHEPRVIPLVADVGPELIAADDGLMLLRDIEGPDRYDAPEEWMVPRWVAVQHEWSGRVDGMPDWRADSFIRSVDALGCPDELLAELPQRFEELAACGLPDTIVHGDFHAGNWRGSTLLDWGDSGIGHPLLDQPAFGAGTAPWVEAWKAIRPGADPARAAHVIAPIAALRQALVYQTFLDNIEPSERVYHRNDPAEWLERAGDAHRRFPLP